MEGNETYKTKKILVDDVKPGDILIGGTPNSFGIWEGKITVASAVLRKNDMSIMTTTGRALSFEYGVEVEKEITPAEEAEDHVRLLITVKNLKAKIRGLCADIATDAKNIRKEWEPIAETLQDLEEGTMTAEENGIEDYFELVASSLKEALDQAVDMKETYRELEVTMADLERVEDFLS